MRACFLSFCVTHTHIKESFASANRIVTIECKGAREFTDDRSVNSLGWRPSRQSSRKFHCRWKNRDYSRTTRSLPPLLRPRAPDSADSFGFRRRWRDGTKQRELLYENTIARNWRVEQAFQSRINGKLEHLKAVRRIYI